MASFLEKVKEEIAARVDAGLAAAGRAEADRESLRTLLKGNAIGVAICAIAIVAVSGNPGERVHRMLVVVVVFVLAAIWAAVRQRCAVTSGQPYLSVRGPWTRVALSRWVSRQRPSAGWAAVPSSSTQRPQSS